MAQPLMPHATASWLVDNTSLSFPQIAEFCGLHVLEVQAIADDTAATKLTGRDPVRAHELTQDEIDKGQADPNYVLKMIKGPEQVRRTKGPRYTPVSKRQDKPDGIAWIIRNHPEITDGAIGNLIGTTRTTIAAIRDRSHWNIANITPKDPVTLGLTTQRELDAAVAKAAKAAGTEAQPTDTRLEGDREALIAQLHAEREQSARDANTALHGDDPAAQARALFDDPFRR
ncbi:cell cycle transcriptional regulator TrcR [Sphingomonas sp. 1P08PE]|uniref:cell cycle transcriptional regulator TrcR n=1 Tax=Sphingomonas sp. 1P08PE TaxID=554122 RepID=UPI0039A301D6